MKSNAKRSKGILGGATSIILLKVLILICAVYLVGKVILDAHASGKLKIRNTPDDELIRWVRQRGGTVNFYIGKSRQSSLRGAIATKDIPPGGVIVSIPISTMIELPQLDHQGFAAEYARDVARRMHLDPSFNVTYATYFSTLPKPDAMVMPQMWSPEHVTALQAPVLEAVADYARRVTEEIYYGNYSGVSYPPMADSLGDKMSISSFKYVAALVGSRFFGIDAKDIESNATDASHTISENSRKQVEYLAPVVDLVNHANDVQGKNAWQTTYKGFLKLRALRPIRSGEEVRYNYQPGVVHRNDMSLLIYGFIQKLNPPMLCSIDLPTFTLPHLYAKTPETDDDFYGSRGAYNTVEEYERLGSLLAEMPTTEAEDVALLESGQVTDQVEHLLIEFRIERKRALMWARRQIDRMLQVQNNATGNNNNTIGDALEEINDEL